MFLVDTSIWVDHFKSPEGNEALIEVLEFGFVTLHPLVLGELALGGFLRNPKIRSALLILPRLPEPNSKDVLDFIDYQGLVGQGIGWVDACLVYTGVTRKLQFLTMDKRLAEVYGECKG